MRDKDIILDYVNVNEALRYLGYGDNKPDDNTKKLLDICSEELLKVIQPKYVYRVFDLNEDYSIDGVDFELKGEAIKNHLKGCEKIAMMCVTLSSGVDSLIRRKQIGDMAQAAIIDSMASAAVEQVCDKVEEIIKKEFPHYEYTWRFGVGYDDFPLELQQQFLNVVNASKQIGVCVNDSFMLTPTKSVTCIIGMGHNLNTSSKKSCDNCSFREKCPYRKAGKNCGR